MIDFKGRGYPKPVVKVLPREDGVFLRGDDEQVAESWMELFIPWTELLRLTSLVLLRRMQAGLPYLQSDSDDAMAYALHAEHPKMTSQNAPGSTNGNEPGP